MSASVRFPDDEERQLQALAEETGRTFPRLIHFIALFGAAQYRALLEAHGEGYADAAVAHVRQRVAERQQESPQCWPQSIEGKPTPTVDDLPGLFGEDAQ